MASQASTRQSNAGGSSAGGSSAKENYLCKPSRGKTEKNLEEKKEVSFRPSALFWPGGCRRDIGVGPIIASGKDSRRSKRELIPQSILRKRQQKASDRKSISWRWENIILVIGGGTPDRPILGCNRGPLCLSSRQAMLAWVNLTLNQFLRNLEFYWNFGCIF